MEIAFGVLPLTVLVLQGYRRVNTFVTNYKCYDDDVKQILRTVEVQEFTFKQNLDMFFRDIIQEDIRRTMLADLSNPHWRKDELNTRLNSMLGSDTNAVESAILSCWHTLKKIQDSQVLSLERLAKEGDPAQVAQTISRVSIRNHLIPRRSRNPRKRIIFLVKDLVAELQKLCNELRNYISDLQRILKLIKRSRRDGRGNEEHLSPHTPSAADISKARRETELIYAASGRLQQVVSSALICKCHTVHLCLDGQAVRTTVINSCDDGGPRNLETPTDLQPRFSFLFAHGSGTTMKPGSMLVCFQPDTSGAVVAVSQAPNQGAHGNICAEVASEREDYERYVQDPSQLSGGFRLRLAPSLPHILGASGCGGYVSLQQLIMTRFRELTNHDRFLIAITLAQSLLHLYCSPWVRDWGIGTIYYFTAQSCKEAAIGRWTPHLVLGPGGGTSDVGDRNRDVYRLGYLLLQLGDLCGGDFDEPVHQSREAIERVIDRVYRSMGSRYVRFVRSCLEVWGQRREFDLMREQNLVSFLAHVGELKTGAMCLSPPAVRVA